jgi:short-subunit dehydrogenase
MMNIAQKTIVITGASKGLGRAMALHCSRKQANVILMARTETLLQQVQAEIEALSGKAPTIIQCDISSESDVQHMAKIIQEQYGQVDVLINNAGFGDYRTSENMSNQEMRRHFEVNFFGAYYCIKALLPLLNQSGAGYILNVGSLFSKIALAETSVYAATKFALAGFSEGLRRELKPFGIKVGLVLLGTMKTSFHKNMGEQTLKVPDFLMLDPKKIAVKLENMIRWRQKQMILPLWMMLALKLRYW